MSAVDEKFLEEVLNDTKEQERRRISMNKKRTATILVAAALVVTMAATAVAAGVSKISTLGDYFEGNRQYFEIPDEVPIMQNPEDYANEVTASTKAEDINGVVNAAGAIDNYTPPAPGEAKVVAVSATEYSLFMTVEVNVAGLNIPKELPEDAGQNGNYYFYGIDKNFECAFAGTGSTSYEGDIMTFILSWDNVIFPEDEIVVKLSRIGYTAYSGPTPEGYRTKEFKAVNDLEVELRVPMSEINFMERIKSTNTAELFGIEYSAELSPYELIVCADRDVFIAAGYDFESTEGINEYTELSMKVHGCRIELHMLDGTVAEHDVMSQKYLMRSHSGFMNFNNKAGCTFFFAVPIDTAQIDYITVDDARFDFAH